MTSQIPNFGLQGKARPSDSSGEYNVLLFIIRQVLSKVNVAAIVKVLAVDGGGVGPVGFVDVQPLVNQVDGYGNAIPQGILHNLPYTRMQGGTNAVILDPQIGDLGICIFADKDISSVKATKKQANPGSRRRFDVADGMYLGGLLNGTPTQYVEFTAGGITVVSPSEITLQAPTINLEGAVVASSTINATGEVTGNGKQLSTHTHSGVQPGSGNSGPPT
jgi:hypothetical protein